MNGRLLRTHSWTRVLLAVALSLTPAPIIAESALSDITQLGWQHRKLLIWEPTPTHTLRALRAYDEEVLDRDLIWFVFNDDQTISNYTGPLSSSLNTQMTRRYGHLRKSILLIGKDGGLKMQANALNLEAIFQEIDSMPMRMMEMNHQ